MNENIFMDGIRKTIDIKYWENITNEDNIITSILTIQLCFECIIESYICACINDPELFKKVESSEKDKITFNPPFITKLKLAQKLGLPIEAYRAIDYLNTIRNQFAHKLDPIINNDLIDNIQKNITLFSPKQPILNYIKTYNKDGTLKKQYRYDDSSTPPVIKLVILYGSFLEKLISHIRGFCE